VASWCQRKPVFVKAARVTGSRFHDKQSRLPTWRKRLKIRRLRRVSGIHDKLSVL
jgi:hypothetical protein